MVEIHYTVKRYPRLPLTDIAERILGKKYTLSVVVCGDTLATRLNKQHRKKSYRPNVLSFPLGDHEGELFLNVRCAEREARAQKKTLVEHCAFLFIHGCLHLKGLDHGKKMDALESRYLKKFLS